MLKTLAVAALVGGLMAVPTVAPVQAASAMPAKCLILPLLQADCRAAISNIVSAHHAASLDAKQGPRFAWWWALDCTRADAGSKHLYDCN